MPYFKRRKYSIGMQFLDKAVLYDKHWLDYRAFIKCIFSKDYEGSEIDFQKAKSLNGNTYIMDHTYNFYISLCYLQTDRFKKAQQLLIYDIGQTEKQHDESWIHYLDLFYLGIVNYELQDFPAALKAFDKALAKYSNFSDAEYFKGKVLYLQGKHKEGYELMKKAKADFEKGYTINEDNSIYEQYPYQVNWKIVNL